MTIGIALFAGGFLAACGGSGAADAPDSSSGGRSLAITLSGTLTLTEEVPQETRRVLLNAIATTRCLKRRFGLVTEHQSQPSRWFGGEILGRVSVVTFDHRSASPTFTPGADIGFAENEEEARKIERTLREGAAVPLETVFRRKGNVVVVWEGPGAPRKLRRRVEGCVSS
jgi:hypothetical protein